MQNDKKDITIFVATHKQYWMPADDIYKPVFVGAALLGDKQISCLEERYARDDTGENISKKNKNFCELTAVYWIWKNIKREYYGIVHYRRYFSNKKIFLPKVKRILSGREISNLLDENDILLPKPRHYYIETNYSQYIHAHNSEDLDLTEKIILERYPEYAEAWDKCMNSTVGHRFNMFVMSDERFNEYCKWLFDILFELERRLDISNYSENDRRVFGFVSERLLDIWIEANEYAYKEVDYVFLERQNWILKSFNFLKRKVK